MPNKFFDRFADIKPHRCYRRPEEEESRQAPYEGRASACWFLYRCPGRRFAHSHFRYRRRRHGRFGRLIPSSAARRTVSRPRPNRVGEKTRYVRRKLLQDT